MNVHLEDARLLEYASGLLSAEECAAVEEHADACSICEGRLARVAAEERVLRQAIALAGKRKRPARRRWIAAAAVLALAATVLGWVLLPAPLPRFSAEAEVLPTERLELGTGASSDECALRLKAEAADRVDITLRPGESAGRDVRGWVFVDGVRSVTLWPVGASGALRWTTGVAALGPTRRAEVYVGRGDAAPDEATVRELRAGGASRAWQRCTVEVLQSE